MSCPHCSSDVPSDAEFCPNCGVKLSVSCEKCGVVNVSGDRYCKKCGERFAGTSSTIPSNTTGSLDRTLENAERQMILDALSKVSWIQARAAELLGITERSLWYRIKKLKIQIATEDHEL